MHCTLKRSAPFQYDPDSLDRQDVIFDNSTVGCAGIRIFMPKAENSGNKGGVWAYALAVWHLLHGPYGAHPYHLTLMQALVVGNYARRFEYCNFMQNILEENPSFLFNILCAEELAIIYFSF